MVAAPMSALAEALIAAQSRAVAALGKQYVGGQVDGDTVRIALDGLGLTDPTDTERWLHALDILRETGAAMPNGDTAGTQERPSSPAQRGLIDKLCDERGIVKPQAYPRLFAEASAIIDKIKAGNFDPNEHPELYL